MAPHQHFQEGKVSEKCMRLENPSSRGKLLRTALFAELCTGKNIFLNSRQHFELNEIIGNNLSHGG